MVHLFQTSGRNWFKSFASFGRSLLDTVVSMSGMFLLRFDIALINQDVTITKDAELTLNTSSYYYTIGERIGAFGTRGVFNIELSLEHSGSKPQNIIFFPC